MEAEVALLSGDQPGFLRLPQERMRDLLSTRPIHELFEVEEEPFARGKYAAVRRCRDRETGEAFAAKFLRKRRRSTDLKPEIVHEVAVLEACSACPRIVRLYRVLESDSEMVLVLELAPGGELQMLLDRDEVPEEAEAARLMAQILDGIAYLHSINVAHLDIKPQNLVLTGEFPHCDVKLCDFGISRYISKGADIREILGTPDYVAPEVLNYEPISLATDMWSVGVLLYVLLTGCSPFGGDTKQETFCNISQSKLDFPADLFGDISDEAIDLIRKLLIKEPSKRLTAQECLQHDWFTKFVNGMIKQPSLASTVNMSAIPTEHKISTFSSNTTDKMCKTAKEVSMPSSKNSINISAQVTEKSPVVLKGKSEIQSTVKPSTGISRKVEEVATVRSNDFGISPTRKNGFTQNMNDILKRIDDAPKSPTAMVAQRTKALAMRTMPANATYTFSNKDRPQAIKAPKETEGYDTNKLKSERHFPPVRQKTDCIYKIRRCYIEDTDEEDYDIPPPLPPSQPPPQQLLPGNAHLRLLPCTTSTSPAPSSSSGCSSASSSAEGHSDHGSDASSDATSEISGDSSSDRSSIISLDDSLDIPYSKRVSIYSTTYTHSNGLSPSTIICDSWENSSYGTISSKQRMAQVNQRQHLSSRRPEQTNMRQLHQRWDRECSGSWQRAFSRFESSDSQVQQKDLYGKSMLSMRSLRRFDRSVPSGLNEIGTVKKCGVQLQQENNGNVVVIRELKSGRFSRFSEVKCESIQARIRKLQEQTKS